MMNPMFKRFLIVMMVLGLSGIFLWSQASLQPSKQWRQVATLTNDVSEGQTLLDVKWIIPGKTSQLILIESPDRREAEVSAIENIYGNHIVLQKRLERDFAKGSSLYQQASSEETSD